MVEIPLDTLLAMQNDQFKVGEMITCNFKFNGFYSGEKIARDIPEFRERTGLVEGLTKTLAFLEEHNAILNSDDFHWEDEAIKIQLSTRRKI